MAPAEEPVTIEEDKVSDPFRTTWAGMAFLLALAGFGAALFFDAPPYVSTLDILWAASFLAFPVVGLVLALKVPANAVGWLFIIGPACVLWGVAFSEAGADEAGSSIFALGLISIFASLVLFPDGRYPNRWIMYAHIAAVLGVLIEPRLSAPTEGALAISGYLALAIFVLVYRTVTGSSLRRRQIGAPAFVAVTGVVGTLLLGLAPGSGDALRTLPIIYLLIGVPTAIGASVLRYKLYDLDRLVSRTVTYVATVASLGGAYTGLVIGLRALVPMQGDLPVAISTLIVASLFLPVVRRVQRMVDRRFFRSRYDSGVVVARVANDLRGHLDLTQAVTGVEKVIGEVLSPKSVQVWIAAET